MRLIDADKLYPDRMTNKGVAISQSQIADAPTIEIRPTGKWEKVIDQNDRRYIFKCSICGRVIKDCYRDDLAEFYPYCHCGARMEIGL